MRKKKNARRIDIFRTIRLERKRFISLAVITMLGVVMLTGLKAACADLRHSADYFFDTQQLFDLSVQSPYGLTEDDLEAIKVLDGVLFAEGTWSQTAYTEAAGSQQTTEIKAISETGINLPYVLEGTLPQQEDEIAVSSNYLSATGKELGDTVMIEVQPGLGNTLETSTIGSSELRQKEYVITAEIIDPMDVNASEGAVSFRSTATTDYIFYVTLEAVKQPVYTVIYILVKDAADLSCYSEDYEELIATLKEKVEQENWYVLDRSSLSGFMNVKSDSSCIEAIGNVFPIIFFLVAILISLTTVTRMVEEERGVIGTYKALGFKDREIREKYLLFSGGASFLGGIIGDIGGFIILPEIIFTIFSTMYQIPEYSLRFDYLTGLGGILLFTGGILAAAFLSCYEQMKQMPATLMRPEAPKAGKKIMLELLPVLWKHFSFLNKVTARNLFRYKKRLLMTVGGILGCTALLVCGFAIKDSVADLLPGQYEKIYRYDMLAVAVNPDALWDSLQETSMNDTEHGETEAGNESGQIASWIPIYTTNVKVTGMNGNMETVQIIVMPDEADLGKYIALKSSETKKEIELDRNSIAVTKNLSVILDFAEGDEVTLQTLTLQKSKAAVGIIVENYLGNAVYMRESVYQRLFGEFSYNGAFIQCSENCEDQIAFADTLAERDGISTVVSTQALKDEFQSAFAMINMVVYIIIGLAACLAFVVLFTLSTTNISERERELSTIKVLGFYDAEVHLYVNKETLILTGIGILLGLPVGTILGRALTGALAMPSIYFAVSIHTISYVIAALLAFGFAIIVDLITNRFVDKIDPVEALKSVE